MLIEEAVTTLRGYRDGLLPSYCSLPPEMREVFTSMQNARAPNGGAGGGIAISSSPRMYGLEGSRRGAGGW